MALSSRGDLSGCHPLMEGARGDAEAAEGDVGGGGGRASSQFHFMGSSIPTCLAGAASHIRQDCARWGQRQGPVGSISMPKGR